MTAGDREMGRVRSRLRGPSDGNPFVDVTLDVDFSLRQPRQSRRPASTTATASIASASCRMRKANGRYRTRSNVAALERQDRRVSLRRRRPPAITARSGCATGSTSPMPTATPYFPFGTTCYAWTHQPLDMQRQTLADAADLRLQQAAHGRLSQALHLQRERAASRRLRAQRRTARSTSTGRTSSRSGISRRRSPRCATWASRPTSSSSTPTTAGAIATMSRRAGRPLRALSRRAARRLSQRLVVARQRIRLPARREADRADGIASSTSSRRTTRLGI